MGDLPDLPFKLVLNYLDLGDLIRCRAVSRRWREKVDSIRVESLFFSEWPSGCIINKSRLVVADFVRNYISSPKFESFFGHFGRSLLGRLRHLRVCDLCLKSRCPAFIAAVHSFSGSLEHLDLVRVDDLCDDFELNLQHLKSIRLEHCEINSLTLIAPKLAELKLWYIGESRLRIVHAEPVRSVVADKEYFDVEQLVNLEFFYCRKIAVIKDGLLAGLKQLKEIHLNGNQNALRLLYEEKRKHGRADLKIYHLGLCSISPTPGIDGDLGLSEALLNRMADNYSSSADLLPLYQQLDYAEIEGAFSKLPIDFWSRLTNLEKVYVSRPVRDEKNFFRFLRACDRNVRTLIFYRSHPQHLFDQLPLHVQNVQFLQINQNSANLDFAFLLNLPNLIDLYVTKIRLEMVRKVFESLRFVRGFWFELDGQDAFIKCDRSEQLSLRFRGRRAVFGSFDELFASLNSYGRPGI